MNTNGHLERNSIQCEMTLIFARQVTKEMIEKTETYAAVYIILRAVGRSENPGGGGRVVLW